MDKILTRGKILEVRMQVYHLSCPKKSVEQPRSPYTLRTTSNFHSQTVYKEEGEIILKVV